MNPLLTPDIFDGIEYREPTKEDNLLLQTWFARINDQGGGTFEAPWYKEKYVFRKIPTREEVKDAVLLLRRRAHQRLEFIAAETLSEKLIYADEDGHALTANNPLPEKLRWTLCGADRWDQTATANPLDDIADAYAEAKAAKMLMSHRTMNTLLKTHCLRDLFMKTVQSQLPRKPDEDRAYKCHGCGSTTSGKTCEFCGNPRLDEGKFTGTSMLSLEFLKKWISGIEPICYDQGYESQTYEKNGKTLTKYAPYIPEGIVYFLPREPVGEFLIEKPLMMETRVIPTPNLIELIFSMKMLAVIARKYLLLEVY